MGVRVLLAVHALVLLLSGLVWFVPGPAEAVIALHGWHRASLIAGVMVAVIAHLLMLHRSPRAAAPSTLALPLLLPSMLGTVVGLDRARTAAQALAQDANNPAFEAVVVWFGGAEAASALGIGFFVSGVLLLAGSVGAAGMLVARGGLAMDRTVQQRLAVGLAFVVTSVLVRVSSGHVVLPSDVISWVSVLAAVSLVLLVGSRSRVAWRQGWQLTLLRAMGVMLPLGTTFTVVGWRAVQAGYLMGLVGSTGSVDRLDALSSSVGTGDAAVSALVVVGAVLAASSGWGGGPRGARSGRLLLACALFLMLGVVGSLSVVQGSRASRLAAWSGAKLGEDVGVPRVPHGASSWVPDLPTVIVPEGGVPRLVTGIEPGDASDLTPAAIREVPASLPPLARPQRLSADDREGGCVMGKETVGMRMPSTTLVVDRTVAFGTLSAYLGPLGGSEPRLYAAVTMRPGVAKLGSLPSPWGSLGPLAFATVTVIRVEPTVHRALRALPGTSPTRFVAQPEQDGLLVVQHSGARGTYDEHVGPNDDKPIGPCFFSVGCHAVPCELVIGVPPGWSFERVMRLVGFVDATRRSGMSPAYRGHHVITLTPDVQGVEAVVRDTRSRNAARGKK